MCVSVCERVCGVVYVCVSLTSLFPSPSLSLTYTQSFLRQLFTVDLPALMVLPKRLELDIPPSVTSIAEAAVGRDVIMRAVASAVLQVRALGISLYLSKPHTCNTPFNY